MVSHKHLLEYSKVDDIDARVDKLNIKYLESCAIYENDLVVSLIKDYFRAFPYTRKTKPRTILCYYRDLIAKYI